MPIIIVLERPYQGFLLGLLVFPGRCPGLSWVALSGPHILCRERVRADENWRIEMRPTLFPHSPNPRHAPPGAFHVLAVVLAEVVDQQLLFPRHADEVERGKCHEQGGPGDPVPQQQNLGDAPE